MCSQPAHARYEIGASAQDLGAFPGRKYGRHGRDLRIEKWSPRTSVPAMIVRRLWPALLIVVAVATAGCSDDGRSKAAKPANAFRARLHELCGSFRRDLKSALMPLGRTLKRRGLSAKEFAANDRLLTQTSQLIESMVLPRFRAFIDDARALDPPKQDATAVAGILDAYEKTYTAYTRKPISAIDPDADAAIETAQRRYRYTLCEAK